MNRNRSCCGLLIVWLRLFSSVFVAEIAVGDVIDRTGVTTPPPDPAKIPEFRIEAGTRQERPNGSITLLRGEPSLLPDPAPDPPPRELTIEDQTRLAHRRAEWLAKPARKSLFLSATVVDRYQTFLRWHDPEQGTRYEAWSNIDFNHMSGFVSLETEGVEWTFLMGIRNFGSERSDKRAWLPPASVDVQGPEPRFVVTLGDPSRREALAPIRALHEHYAKHREELIANRQQWELVRLRLAEAERARAAEPKHTVMWFRPRKGSRYLEASAPAER